MTFPNTLFSLKQKNGLVALGQARNATRAALVYTKGFNSAVNP